MYRRSMPRANIVVLLVGFLAMLALLAACSKPAPSPAPQPPKPASPPAAAPAPAGKPDPLAQIVEGAKKEGTVSVSLLNTYMTPANEQRIEKWLKDTYGLTIDVKITGTTRQAGQLADSIMEYKTGANPKYELISFNANYVADGVKAGILESVDWKPLLLPGTPPGVISEVPVLRGTIAYQTGLNGLVYNPQKIPANQVPKTINDLADPKWKGKLAIHNYPAHWSRWAFALGKDKTIATLKEIMKNKPLLGRFDDINDRYLLGEVQMAFTVDTYLIQDRAKGMPAEWQALDFLDVRDNHLALVKKAPHPNAAKLVAIYLAGPEGVKMTTDSSQGFRSYSGNHVYDIVTQTQKQGAPVKFVETSPEYIDFVSNGTDEKWQKEIDLILKGG